MTDRNTLGLTALCAVTGVLHFAQPEPFDKMIPPRLPGSPRAWTYGSGAAELAVAALLAMPRTRHIGGYAAAALFVAVYPGNLQMAWDARRRPAKQQAVTVGRLPMQFDLVRRALQVARAN